MNRSNSRLKLFETEADYRAFEAVLTKFKVRFPAMRVPAYCLMPKHFHFVLWLGGLDGLRRKTGKP